MESSAEFRKIMAIARRASSKTNAEFDYSLAFEQSYDGAATHVSHAIHTLANEGLDGTAEERAAHASALAARVAPELDALIDECKLKSYTGWSNASSGPIRYAR